MRLRAMALSLAVVAAGCTGATATPTPVPATPAPTPSPSPAWSDAELEGLMLNSIDVRFCGEEPYADWCDSLIELDRAYNLSVEGDSFSIVTTIANTKKGRKLAARMCADLAAATSVDSGESIGITFLAVYADDAETLLADCEPKS